MNGWKRSLESESTRKQEYLEKRTDYGQYGWEIFNETELTTLAPAAREMAEDKSGDA